MSITYSQEQVELVRVKYFDGSSYYGEKLQEGERYVLLLLQTGDTIEIDKKYAKEYYDNSNAEVFKNGKFYRNTGYFFLLTLGGNAETIYNPDDQRISSHIGLHYGYRFTPRLSLSGGFGIELNEARAAGFVFETQYTSLYAYGRYHFFTGRPQIFGFGRIGFGTPGEEDSEDFPSEFQGGVNAMYGLGTIFASKGRSKFVLSLGHYFQKSKGQQTFLDPIGNEVNTKFDLMIQRLVLTLGWEIN